MLSILYKVCANAFLPTGSPDSFHLGHLLSLPSAQMVTIRCLPPSEIIVLLLDISLLNLLLTCPHLLRDRDFIGYFLQKLVQFPGL